MILVKTKNPDKDIHNYKNKFISNKKVFFYKTSLMVSIKSSVKLVRIQSESTFEGEIDKRFIDNTVCLNYCVTKQINYNDVMNTYGFLTRSENPTMFLYCQFQNEYTAEIITFAKGMSVVSLSEASVHVVIDYWLTKYSKEFNNIISLIYPIPQQQS